MVSEYGRDDADRAKAAVLAHLDAWESETRRDRFSWPLDAFAAEWWGYQVAVNWTVAWNKEGRATPAADSLRAWLDTPAFAEAWARAVEWAESPDAFPAHRRIPTRAS